MWLANALTLIRIPLAGVFWVTYGDRNASLAVVALAALTDALDGKVARWARAHAPTAQDVRGSAGEWLDPLADKIFIGAVLATVWAHGHLPWALLALTLSRELVLVPLAAIYRLVLVSHPVPHAFQADGLGKATTIAQLATAAAAIARPAAVPALAIATAALGLAAAAHYIVRGRARLAH